MRKQAGRLFAAGKMIHAAIARELRVSRQSVSRWYAEWRRGARAHGFDGFFGSSTLVPNKHERRRDRLFD